MEGNGGFLMTLGIKNIISVRNKSGNKANGFLSVCSVAGLFSLPIFCALKAGD
jgi:hypothetical protein